ncbi:outer membrane protein TolC [Chitinophaga skermanii]|uniref:Outer membrane protein TolC n=2 Tax=Chitinophaga skermanii TaxID=331697 RepID=A0A327RAH9_9BACT|nr:outer membrane protein TolC [Chitinophaga skermanii]
MTHKRILTLIIALQAAFVAPLLAQTAGTAPSINRLNLQSSIQYALEHQYTLLNARLATKKSVEQVREQRGKLFPHAEINANFVDNIKLATSLIPDISAGGNPNNRIPVQFGTKFTSNVTGQVNQTIFNSDYFLGLKAAKVYTELSTKDLRRTEIDTRVAVTEAYLNVLVNKEAIEILVANRDQLKKTLEDTKARYDVGIAERIDVDRIQVSFNTTETQVKNAERLLYYSYFVLKFQMSMPEADSLELMETVRDFDPTKDLPQDTSMYEPHDRVEYSMQETQIALNQLDLKSKKLSILPSLNAYVNYGWNFFGADMGELYKSGFGASAFGVTFSWPVFQGTERVHRVNQSKITLQQSYYDLQNLTLQIQLEVRQAFTEYQNNMLILSTQKQNMELNQGIYDRVELKFEQGVATSLDVISAEAELKQSQGDYINSLLNALLSKVQLDKAMGKIQTTGR